MSNIIKIFQGSLLEGETVELFADFSCNYVSNLFTNKRWLVLGEKDLKFDSLTQEYYNETGKKNIFESIGDDYITITDLKVGRYLAIFTYTDILGNKKIEKEMLTVFPQVKLIYDKNITEGETKTISINSSLLNTSTVLTFSDNNETLTITDNVVDRLFPLEGYHSISIQTEYNNAKYDEEGEPVVVWLSQPSDRLVGVSGPYGEGTIVDSTYTETTSDSYLTKLEVSTSSLYDKINIDLSVSFNGDQVHAPANVYILDRSSYFTLYGTKKQYWDMTKNLPVEDYVPLLENGNPDPAFFLDINDIFTSDHRIDYTELYFGDGQVIRGKNIGFEYQKNYEKSGKYQIKYVVLTRHYVSIIEETTDTIEAGLIKDIEDGRLYYTNKLEYIENFEVKAFFTKWLKDHSVKSLYNSNGFNDLTTAVGKQLDRVYNQGKSVIDSIDVETIDDNFIKNYFNTYGDFEEIAVKIGFSGFTKNKSNIYDMLEGYNFFDRVKSGKVTVEEKAEFLNYIRSAQDRLQTKGTPSSIERELDRFGLESSVVELWTDDMDKLSKDDVLIDEVFSGKNVIYNTGLTFEASSTPMSDNTSSLITNSNKNSYIEINSYNEKKNFYFTKDTPITQIGCTKYAKFENVILDYNSAIDYVFEALFDDWADSCIGSGLWARKYKNDFGSLGNFRWIDLLDQQWKDSIVETLKNVGTDGLYRELILRYGEMGELIWTSFDMETWDSDLEAPILFTQGVNDKTILSLETGEIIFGEYSQKSYEVGKTLYFKTTDILIDAYVTDVHGVVINFESLNDGVWDSDITGATAYVDGFFHYKATLSSKSNYFKGWVFSKDDGFVFRADAQFRLECQDVDILTVTFDEEVVEEEIIEDTNTLSSFVESSFKCVPVIPQETIEEFIQETTPSEFISNLESARMNIIKGTQKSSTTISAFNKCVEIADRSKLPSGLLEGEYAYFSTTEKLTYGSVTDIDGNEYMIEYKNVNSFIKPNIMSDLTNAELIDGVYFYRWRVPKDNFVFSDKVAFKFKSTKNFDIAIYNASIYDQLISQVIWGNEGKIIWGASTLLTWEDLFIGTNFNEIILL